MIKAYGLRCEYAENPLGIDAENPRFSWKLAHPKRVQRMTAFQVLVATTSEKLKSDEGDVWDSGKVLSTGDLPIDFGGRPLTSGERCYWKVRAWDRQDESEGDPGDYSAIAWFEMGLLRQEDWQAEWIGYPATWNGHALYFHKGFSLEKPVCKGRVYIAGLGYYELFLNGLKVGDHVLDPGVTDYSKRVLYVTYDVTDELKTGRNAIGVVLGNGWYGAPKLLCHLVIEYEDGSTICIGTGPDWQATPGPILDNSVYGGETYDARLEDAGWHTAEGEKSWKWFMAMVTDGPGGRLVAQTTNPIQVIQTLIPQSLTQPRPGVFVYDMGQNTAGWARLHVMGKAGDQVTLKYAEMLYEDGTVNQENLRGAKATDIYILKGGDKETWEPHFTYHGFRFVQVEGFPCSPTLNDIEGRVVRSSVIPCGEFICSNELLNQIFKMVWWTEYSNHHSIPTDCPQRDERMGWLNDLGARSEEAFYNFDMSRFMAKFVDDIEDAQHPLTGAITDTAPFRWGSRPADPVSVSYLLLPWLLYRFYNNRRALKNHYVGLKHWVDYLTTRAENFMVSYSYYGDWAPPIQEAADGTIGDSAVSRLTPGALVSTAYYYYSAQLISQFATLLGNSVDAAMYASLAEKIKRVYNEHFWDETLGGYGSNNQACNALSLYMGLVPEERQKLTLNNLVRDVEDVHHNHLSTGNLCTKYLFEVLTDHGRADVAYRIATQTTYPSWGYMLANGATTLWERWEKMTGSGMNSHNHPMMGSVGSWFYKAIAGINLNLSEGTAFSYFRIRPHVVGDLKFARAKLNTLRGDIVSSWEKADNSISMMVVVPVGSQAWVSVPKLSNKNCTIAEGGTTLWRDGRLVSQVIGVYNDQDEEDYVTFVIGSGEYHFESK